MVETLKDSDTKVKVSVKFPRPQNAYAFLLAGAGSFVPGQHRKSSRHRTPCVPLRCFRNMKLRIIKTLGVKEDRILVKNDETGYGKADCSVLPKNTTEEQILQACRDYCYNAKAFCFSSSY